MGNYHFRRKSVPPPHQDMIGEWLLNPRSRNFRIGQGENRYKRGSNLLGVGLSGPPSAMAVCRLIIKQDGTIDFYSYTPECWMVLSGPVYSWKNGKIKSISRSCLNYDATHLKQKKILIVDDLVLRKAENVPQA